MAYRSEDSNTLSSSSSWWVSIKEESDTNHGIPKNRRSISSVIYHIPPIHPPTNSHNDLNNDDDGEIDDDTSSSTDDIHSSNNNTDSSNTTISSKNETTTVNNHTTTNSSSSSSSLPTSSPTTNDSHSQRNHNQRRHLQTTTPLPSENYIILSGGFTDTDWTTFPVWAINITNTASSHAASYRSLLPSSNKNNDDDNNNNNNSSLPGRVGHMSAVYDNHLYIFGGLLYEDNSFYVEDRVMIHRAKIVGLSSSSSDDDDDEWEWESLTPVVDAGGEEYLPRGEAQGGVYGEGEDTMLVIHAGLHVRRSPTSTHHAGTVQVDIPQSDVWAYFFSNNTLSLLSSGRGDGIPTARTAHAGTIVNSELIIYGGMSLNLDSWSGLKWDMLADVWAFDIPTRHWRQIFVYPNLMRSYHTMSTTSRGEVVVFGGFRTAETVAGESIAFVFSDTLRLAIPSRADDSEGDENYWYKAQWSPGRNDEGDGVTHRLEHTAIVNPQSDHLYVWGGRFKTVSQIDGLWSLDVGASSAVEWKEAPPDGLDAYEAELQTLHLLVAVMLFMSVLFTALYGTLRRQAEEQGGGGGGVGGGGGSFRRGRGLSPAMINSLPVKRFDAVRDETDDCCPICLVEYETGDEMRLLTCGHEFHKSCVDSWLENNASCPACRAPVEVEEVGNEIEVTPGLIVRSSTIARWITGLRGDGNAVLSHNDERMDSGVPYVSDLELVDEGVNTSASNNNALEMTTTSTTTPATTTTPSSTSIDVAAGEEGRVSSSSSPISTTTRNRSRNNRRRRPRSRRYSRRLVDSSGERGETELVTLNRPLQSII